MTSAWVAFALVVGPATSLDAEPTIDEVLASLAPPSLGALEDAESRSRWANALPKRLAVRVRRDDSLSLEASATDDGWSDKAKDGDRLVWEVHAQWDLTELVVHRHAPRLLALRRDAERRARLERDGVIALYFERRRRQLLFLSSTDRQKRAVWWADVAEATARLDELTSGLFRRRAVQWWIP